MWGFDIFGQFPKKNLDKFDKAFVKYFEKEGGSGINLDELNQILKEKKFSNFELIKGPIEKTLPIFCKKNLSKKIALLHLDLDVYEPTKLSLNILYKNISKGGIILIDDYNQVIGANKAIDEFLNLHKNLKIKKLNFLYAPSYIVKI